RGLTTKISCRAGCNNIMSRKSVMPARSTSSAGSAPVSIPHQPSIMSPRLSELRLHSRLFAQLVGSDSVKHPVPFDWGGPFPVGVNRVFLAFAQQRKPVVSLHRCQAPKAQLLSRATVAPTFRRWLGNSLWL